MGRDIKANREEILSEINAHSILLKRLWEEVFDETINNNEWDDIKLKVVKIMRQDWECKKNKILLDIK